MTSGINRTVVFPKDSAESPPHPPDLAHLATSSTPSHPLLILVLYKEEFHMTFTLGKCLNFDFGFYHNEINIAGP